MTERAPLDVIADNLPTYADCYKNFTEVQMPSRHRIVKDAAQILVALAEAGYHIVRIDGERPQPAPMKNGETK